MGGLFPGKAELAKHHASTDALPNFGGAGSKNKAAMKWVMAHQAETTPSYNHVEILEGKNYSQEFSEIERVYPIVDSFLTSQKSEK